MSLVIIKSKSKIKAIFREVLEEFLLSSNINLPQKDKTEPEEDLITRKELLKRLKISSVKLWKLMREKKIPFRRLGRRVFFNYKEIVESMEEVKKICG